MDNQKNYEERKQIIKQLMEDPVYRPLKYKELVFLLQVPEEEKSTLSEILQELIHERVIMKTPKGKYQLLKEKHLVGIFTSHPKGFGFVTVEGEEEDYFIPGKYCGNAMHQDKVMIKLLQEHPTGGKRKEAEIITILERGIQEVVGTFMPGKGFGFVIPDNQKINQDIYIPKALTKGAVSGHKVVATITRYPTENHSPEGRITEIIGHINEPGTDILSIARSFDLPTEFQDMELRQAERTPDTVSGKDIAGRKDYRQELTVTIDGEDAKDLDDAITVMRIDGGYRLGVHIADVSHYVTENSPLDQEARRRGTSVYLVDRVIPMLPHSLSNGICSLNQGVDRLTLSCIMDIDEQGKVISHEIAETVICVDRRLSYNEVQHVLSNSSTELTLEYGKIYDMIFLMKELADKLRNRRVERGSVDFDFPESKIVLDAKGIPVEVKPYERLDAHKIIEDFMLLANETVAEDYFWQELPFLYRIHEKPDPERIQQLGVMINNFGYFFKASKESIHPKEFQKLLQSIEGSEQEAMISRLTLRSMKQARYSTSCEGHFGLSTPYYCHFTSPIRRYPDLQIHRIMKENLRGGLLEKRISHYERLLPNVAEETSKLERRAEETEREVEKAKKVQYMAKHVGESYEGVISGVNAWGMFVELPNTIEGLVHVNTMIDDYYIYQEEKYAMIGEEFGKEYHLGQKVWVKVLSVDRQQKTIDFILCNKKKKKNKE